MPLVPPLLAGRLTSAPDWLAATVINRRSTWPITVLMSPCAPRVASRRRPSGALGLMDLAEQPRICWTCLEKMTKGEQ